MPNDIVVSLFIDGAQLYEKKQSDCWIYVWIIINLAPNVRYHKVNVLLGRFIPGPHKPKDVDSFLFPGFHYLASLQCKGLTIWDSSSNTMFRSDPYLLFVTADGPGLVYLDRAIGHTGKNGCQIYVLQNHQSSETTPISLLSSASQATRSLYERP